MGIKESEIASIENSFKKPYYKRQQRNGKEASSKYQRRVWVFFNGKNNSMPVCGWVDLGDKERLMMQEKDERTAGVRMLSR